MVKSSPSKYKKTTQLQQAPHADPRAAAEQGRGGISNQTGGIYFFGGRPSPPPYLLAASLSEGKFHPASRGLGCQVGKKNPICFQSGSSLPSTQPLLPRSQPPELPCVRQAGLADAFFCFFLAFFLLFSSWFLFFFFLLKMYVASFAPPQLSPLLSLSTCSSTALSTLGPAKNLSVLSPATAAGSENSQMTQDFQPRAFF